MADASRWPCAKWALLAVVRALQLEAGAPQLPAYVQSLNPSASGSGPDGVATTLLLKSTSCISSEAFRPALAPFLSARSKWALARFGIGPTLTLPVLSRPTGLS